MAILYEDITLPFREIWRVELFHVTRKCYYHIKDSRLISECANCMTKRSLNDGLILIVRDLKTSADAWEDKDCGYLL